MANENMIKFLRGNVADLPQTATAGALYFTKDEGVYLGLENGSYHRYGDFITVADVSSLPATGAHATCMYYCTSENILARYDSVKGWIQINKQPTADEMKTLLGLGSLAYLSEVSEDNLDEALKEKVNAAAEGNHAHLNKGELDKIADGDVEKWGEAYAHSQTAHAPANAQENVIESVKVNGTALEITDKTVDITVPTGALAGKDKVAEGDLEAELATKINNKVDKVEGKSLIADAEIARLAGMSDGANKVEASETNGNIKIDGVETVVYTHPDKHAIADVDGLQDALDGLQAAGDYAAAEHTHTKSEITDFAHTHTASEVTDLDTTIKGYDYATKAEAQGYANAKDGAIAEAKKAGDDAAAALNAYKGEMTTALAGKQDVIPENTYDAHGSAAKALDDAKKYTDDEIAKIPAQTDYSVTITENTDDATVAKTYVFTQCGEEIGAIKLAKELVVTAGSVKEVTEADAPYAGAKVGDKYIELVIANQDAPIYVPAKDLVDIYTAKDGAAEVQVAISNTNEISATLVNGGVTEEKLAEGVKTKLNKTWEEVGVAKGLVDALEGGQVKANKEAIEAINDTEDGILAQAKGYVDGLIDDYATVEYANTKLDHIKVELTDGDSYIKFSSTNAAGEVDSFKITGEDIISFGKDANDDIVLGLGETVENRFKALEEAGYATEGYVDNAVKGKLDANGWSHDSSTGALQKSGAKGVIALSEGLIGLMHNNDDGSMTAYMMGAGETDGFAIVEMSSSGSAGTAYDKDKILRSAGGAITAEFVFPEKGGIFALTSDVATAEQNAKDYADGLAGNYATKEQGEKADTALQPDNFWADVRYDEGEAEICFLKSDENDNDETVARVFIEGQNHIQILESQETSTVLISTDITDATAEKAGLVKLGAEGGADVYGAAATAKAEAIAEASNQDAVVLAEAQKSIDALAGAVYTKSEVESLMSWGSF